MILKSEAHYEACWQAMNERFSTSGPCISRITGEVIMPASEGINLCWIQSTNPRGAGRKRTKGLTGPKGICEVTGGRHDTRPHTSQNGRQREKCRDCKATWTVAA